MRVGLLTPLYILSAWILMVGYQMFTQISIATVIASLNSFLPNLSAWMISKLDTITFIHNFAWIFVLSSLIPSILLGKERSVTVHFIFCLTFTFVSAWIRDFILGLNSETPFNPVVSAAFLFYNLPVAVFYLCTPYIVMLLLDFHASKLRARRKEEMIKSIEITLSNNAINKGKLRNG
ncbi:MAG: hypothetical protein QW502_04045 [Candidatus Bathyarchaeia archaeon]|nr:hypothetical protein [Candidatus Bathyarchaeota archaeon]